MRDGGDGPRELRLLYLGLPLGALYLQRDGFTLAACGISRPDAPGMWRLRQRLQGAPLLERPNLDRREVRSRLAATRPDVVVSWFWTRRIPRAALDLAAHGGVNVHPSLLPRHRGADPYFWTLRRRDLHTGVTVHRIDEQYDTGPILLQRKVIVPPGADAWRLAKRLDLPSLEALRDALRALRDGAPLAAVPQDPALATDAPAPTDDDCEIRWDEPAEEVQALIRAASPEPGAFTAVGDESVVILDAEVAPRPVATLIHGECVRDQGAIFITCGDGRALRVLRARADDDDAARTGEGVAALFPHAAEVPR